MIPCAHVLSVDNILSGQNESAHVGHSKQSWLLTLCSATSAKIVCKELENLRVPLRVTTGCGALGDGLYAVSSHKGESRGHCPVPPLPDTFVSCCFLCLMVQSSFCSQDSLYGHIQGMDTEGMKLHQLPVMSKPWKDVAKPGVTRVLLQGP